MTRDRAAMLCVVLSLFVFGAGVLFGACWAVIR